ncbi:MAG: hypothetical protein NZM26_01925 [Patescibacteria group bacterium]|nr:hypothetical protein [Patescibacteria group bacterium]
MKEAYATTIGCQREKSLRCHLIVSAVELRENPKKAIQTTCPSGYNVLLVPCGDLLTKYQAECEKCGMNWKVRFSPGCISGDKIPGSLAYTFEYKDIKDTLNQQPDPPNHQPPGNSGSDSMWCLAEEKLFPIKDALESNPPQSSADCPHFHTECPLTGSPIIIGSLRQSGQNQFPKLECTRCGNCYYSNR